MVLVSNIAAFSGYTKRILYNVLFENRLYLCKNPFHNLVRLRPRF